MYIILGEAGVFPLIGDWKTLTLLVGTASHMVGLIIIVSLPHLLLGRQR